MANQPISGKGSISIGPFTIHFDNASLVKSDEPLITDGKAEKQTKLLQERDDILNRLAQIKRELDALSE